MTIQELRSKHPRFIYHSFDKKLEGDKLIISFHFILEPNIEFRPKTSIPIPSGFALSDELDIFLFHVGLIEAISYYKAACPKEFVVEAGTLSLQQIEWLRDLLMHGLGEFFYTNGIDFTEADFVSITTSADAESSLESKMFKLAQRDKKFEGDIILIGGGKDSAVSVELLKEKEKQNVLMINPVSSSLLIAEQTGFHSPLIIKRSIDQRLLELNTQGYFNGHTPFSAYLAFLATLVAWLYGYRNVIASNEFSASEETVLFKNFEINHQYSKSYRFEKMFREYVQHYLTTGIEYFSFLRPLYDLKISQLFSQMRQFHHLFSSCNNKALLQEGYGTGHCGECAKCAFVYLSLFPFLRYQEMMDIFKKDFFQNPKIMHFIKQLVGLEKHKPFECVGTKEESILGVVLCAEQFKKQGMEVPSFLFEISQWFQSSNGKKEELEQKILHGFSNEHFLPETYEDLLKKWL